jgi:hypothetical protein
MGHPADPRRHISDQNRRAATSCVGPTCVVTYLGHSYSKIFAVGAQWDRFNVAVDMPAEGFQELCPMGFDWDSLRPY